MSIENSLDRIAAALEAIAGKPQAFTTPLPQTAATYVSIDNGAASLIPTGATFVTSTPPEPVTTSAPSTTITPPPQAAAPKASRKKAAPSAPTPPVAEPISPAPLKEGAVLAAAAPVAPESALDLRTETVNAIMKLANGEPGLFASQRAAAVAILSKFGAAACSQLKNENLQEALQLANVAIEKAANEKTGIALI